MWWPITLLWILPETWPVLSWLGFCLWVSVGLLFFYVIYEAGLTVMASRSATPRTAQTRPSGRFSPSTRPTGFEPADEPPSFTDPVPEHWTQNRVHGH